MAINKEWWAKLSPMAKQAYLRSHPKSKLRNKKAVSKSAGLVKTNKPKSSVAWVKTPRF